MSTSANPYDIGLDKNAANYVPLTPIGFLMRSASVYPNRLAVVHGERRYSWREALERCRRLGSALTAREIGRGDTVDPSSYYFRTLPRFETAHPAYSFLNRLIAVASGDRRPEGPIYTIHEVV